MIAVQKEGYSSDIIFMWASLTRSPFEFYLDVQNQLLSFTNSTSFSSLLGEPSTFVSLSRRTNIILDSLDRSNFFHHFQYPWSNSSLHPTIISFLSTVSQYRTPIIAILTISLYIWICNSFIPLMKKIGNSLITLLMKWLDTLKKYIRYVPNGSNSSGSVSFFRWNVEYVNDRVDSVEWTLSSRPRDDDDDEDEDENRRRNPFTPPISNYLTKHELNSLIQGLLTLLEDILDKWDDPYSVLIWSVTWNHQLNALNNRLLSLRTILDRLPSDRAGTTALAIIHNNLSTLFATINNVARLVTTVQNLNELEVGIYPAQSESPTAIPQIHNYFFLRNDFNTISVNDGAIFMNTPHIIIHNRSYWARRLGLAIYMLQYYLDKNYNNR